MVDEATEIGKNWWLFVVLGVICVVTGVLAIVWPGLTLLTLGIFAGIYLLVTAVLEIIDAIVGIIILSWPDIGLVTLAVFFAVTMLVRGVLAIVVGFKLRSLLHHRDALPAQTATPA